MCELFDSPACYLFRVIESAALHLCRVPSVAPGAFTPLALVVLEAAQVMSLTCASPLG
jgi:hypothetical protein